MKWVLIAVVVAVYIFGVVVCAGLRWGYPDDWKVVWIWPLDVGVYLIGEVLKKLGMPFSS